MFMTAAQFQVYEVSLHSGFARTRRGTRTRMGTNVQMTPHSFVKSVQSPLPSFCCIQ